jgi:hypothetical protein
VFPTNNQAGQQLLQGIVALMLRLLGEEATVEGCVQASAGQFLNEVHRKADIVILDATIDPEGEHNYTNLGALQNLALFEHVLVVGRSYLPINVRGMRPGGAPIYPHSQTNLEILKWLERQLCDEHDPVPTSRSWFDKTTMGFGAYFGGRRKDRERERRLRQVFISYRGDDIRAARNLKQRAERGDFHDGVPKNVILYEPNELALADEILSPLLRWNVLRARHEINAQFGG